MGEEGQPWIHFKIQQGIKYWFNWEITGLQYMAYLNGKEGKPGAQCRFIFQWKITGLQFVAYLNGRLYLREAGLCRRSWTQWERRDNHGLFSTGNSMFWILGLSQQGIKFEGARFDGKWTTRTHLNGKSQVHNGWFIKLNPTGKKGQSEAHFNGKLQVW